MTRFEPRIFSLKSDRSTYQLRYNHCPSYLPIYLPTYLPTYLHIKFVKIFNSPILFCVDIVDGRLNWNTLWMKSIERGNRLIIQKILIQWKNSWAQNFRFNTKMISYLNNWFADWTIIILDSVPVQFSSFWCISYIFKYIIRSNTCST